MNEEERFDPSRHGLDYAAKRLKQISENSRRLAEVLGRHEEQDTGELATGGVIEPGTIVTTGDSFDLPEIVFPSEPNEAQREWDRLIRQFPALTYDGFRALVRELVHRELYPTAEMANPHKHRRIEMTEENGDKWRGVLYKVERANG